MRELERNNSKLFSGQNICFYYKEYIIRLNGSTAKKPVGRIQERKVMYRSYYNGEINNRAVKSREMGKKLYIEEGL